MKVVRAEQKGEIYDGPPGMNVGDQGKFVFRVLDKEKEEGWKVWLGYIGWEYINVWMIDDLIERLKMVKKLIGNRK